jgi:hypothetical protein
MCIVVVEFLVFSQHSLGRPCPTSSRDPDPGRKSKAKTLVHKAQLLSLPVTLLSSVYQYDDLEEEYTPVRFHLHEIEVMVDSAVFVTFAVHWRLENVLSRSGCYFFTFPSATIIAELHRCHESPI